MSNIQNGNRAVSTNPLHAGKGSGIVQQVRKKQANVEFRPKEGGDKEMIRWQQ